MNKIKVPDGLMGQLPAERQATKNPNFSVGPEVIAKRLPKPVVFDRATAVVFLVELRQSLPMGGGAQQALLEVKELVEKLDDQVRELKAQIIKPFLPRGKR